MALPKASRLKKKKDFQEVFRRGKGFKEDFLFLKVARNGAENSRFGLVVTKKASKKAVVRNRIKRKISEAVRKELPQIKGGWDGIFILSRPLSKEDFVGIEKTTMRLLEKAKLIQ